VGAGRSPDARVEAAAAVLGSLGRRGVLLGALTTYRVGGAAELFVEATTLEHLGLVARAAQVSDLPVLVIGRGSNLLVADAGFVGIAVVLAGAEFASISLPPMRGAPPAGAAAATGGPGAEDALVEAGGAVHLPVLARQSAGAGLRGLEWAVGVPGSVGGAVRMNAGGHGSDVAATLRSCRIVDLRTGTAEIWSLERLRLGYRRSAVEAHLVVTRATFALRPGDRDQAEATIREIVHWRREHQPGGQNAGSVFTNPSGEPPRDSAGWLVEATGLKGFRRGSAMVSDKHANFIQADPGGSADDVVGLMAEVRRRVAERFGVLLQSEVRLVGFDDG